MLLGKGQSKRAVAYYRHSAEDKQENSVTIQRDHTLRFIQQYGIEILHEEADEGETGLLADRPGFNRLFEGWILNPNAPDFEYVLVYDVSRWGRFQDQNEAAYYEFRCKQQGKKVIYVSRGFPDGDNQLISSLQTSIERYMAAEYSRQLSDKVFYGSVKVSEQGYSAGGTPCYGMSRLLLDENKQLIRVLKRGERKVISNQRVTFTPSNDAQTEVVRTIYSALVDEWKTPQEIATQLNHVGVLSPSGRSWKPSSVIRILTNEAYVGTRIYNKTSNRLKMGIKQNPQAEWVFCIDAFSPTIEKDMFARAQENLYWLLPSKWKKGAHAIARVRRMLSQELQALLRSIIESAEDVEMALRQVPIIFSVGTYDADSKSRWCFWIPEEAKRYEQVLAVGIVMDQSKLIHSFFLIPTADFGLGRFAIVDELENYKEYHRTEVQVEEVFKHKVCKSDKDFLQAQSLLSGV